MPNLFFDALSFASPYPLHVFPVSSTNDVLWSAPLKWSRVFVYESIGAGVSVGVEVSVTVGVGVRVIVGVGFGVGVGVGVGVLDTYSPNAKLKLEECRAIPLEIRNSSI